MGDDAGTKRARTAALTTPVPAKAAGAGAEDTGFLFVAAVGTDSLGPAGGRTMVAGNFTCDLLTDVEAVADFNSDVADGGAAGPDFAAPGATDRDGADCAGATTVFPDVAGVADFPEGAAGADGTGAAAAAGFPATDATGTEGAGVDCAGVPAVFPDVDVPE